MEGYSNVQDPPPPYPGQYNDTSHYSSPGQYPTQPGYGPQKHSEDPAYPPNYVPQPPPNYGQTIPSAQYGPAGANVTTVVQPGPPNFLGLALFATLCCFWPVGICAIIKSTEVNSAINRGDYATAKAASDSAKKFSYISIGCGIASSVITTIFIIIYNVVIVAGINNY